MGKIVVVLIMLVIVSFVLASQAGATVIHFDDIVGYGNNSPFDIPEGYNGIEWIGWVCYDHGLSPWEPHSPKVAIESLYNENLIQWPLPVEFNGAWFDGIEEATVTFEGYLDGILQATSSTLIPSNTPTFLEANFGMKVDAVRVISLVPSYFGMDDVTFNEYTNYTNIVPEPSSILFLSFGLLGTGLLGKYRRK